MSQYIVSTKSIPSGGTYKFELGDEDLNPVAVGFARIHQITVETGSVKVLAAVANGGLKEYVTISSSDSPPTVPLILSGLSKLHIEALEDSTFQAVGY